MLLARFAFQACSFIRLRSRAFIASYGEMSRRSGEAAKADNHSDISPFRINNLQSQTAVIWAIVISPPMCHDHLRAFPV